MGTNVQSSDVQNTTITFFSPKGKSGKTSLMANLAIALARQTGEKVGIIDADLQFGDVTVFFDLQPKTTIVEAARDSDYLTPVLLKSCYTTVSDRVYALCGTRSPTLIDKVAIPSLEKVIRLSKSLFRYLLIDVPQGFNPTSIAAAELSDITYLVTMLNGGYELTHIRRSLEIFQAWPDCQQRVKTIFTRVEPCNEESGQRIARIVGYPVEAIIPNAYMTVSKAADDGRMAMELEPNSPLAERINRLAYGIVHKRGMAL